MFGIDPGAITETEVLSPGVPSTADAATFLFASWTSTLNHYIFALLPVVAVLGTFRASQRRFQLLRERGHPHPNRPAAGLVGHAIDGVVRTTARVADVFMLFFFPVPPSAAGMFTRDRPSIIAHGLEYLAVFLLDVRELAGVAVE